MATVTLHVSDELLERVNHTLEKSEMTLDDVFTNALEDLSRRVSDQERFEAMVRRLNAEGIRFPILSREERNAHR
jgi:predicted transcriptional regulator